MQGTRYDETVNLRMWWNTVNFKLDDEIFTFNFYKDVLAVNVKYIHAYPTLSLEYQAKLNKLSQKSGVLDNIEKTVRELVCVNWRESTRARLRNIYPGVTSLLGSKEGPLLLLGVGVEYLEDSYSKYYLECRNCSNPFTQHVNGYCLYDVCKWKSRMGFALDTFHKLRNAVDFVQNSISKPEMDKLIIEEAENLIDSIWESI